jgi:hypothetical protein
MPRTILPEPSAQANRPTTRTLALPRLSNPEHQASLERISDRAIRIALQIFKAYATVPEQMREFDRLAAALRVTADQVDDIRWTVAETTIAPKGSR